MKSKILKINPADNVAVALEELKSGAQVNQDIESIILKTDIQVKHKLALKKFNVDDEIIMYGVVVGRATKGIEKGAAITTANVKHTSSKVSGKTETYQWEPSNVSGLEHLTWNGYVRSDGQVGTRNVWLFFPLVFCENRNIETLKEVFESQLLNPRFTTQKDLLKALITNEKGCGLTVDSANKKQENRLTNVEVKFLTHQGGCGSTREEATDTARLLAGYVNNPNVAGASILSLGCQNLQESVFMKELTQINPTFDKPLLFFNHQKIGDSNAYLNKIISDSFAEIKKANEMERKSVALSKLKIGLECGGSDGFSGITANPLLGIISDMIASVHGSVILAEFPELCGVEQDLVNRCEKNEDAEKFMNLMQAYEQSVVDAGSGFDMNPSPGNIKDGLITDAMKSAGAAKKGGSSPIVAVKDYGEYINEPGLSLLCTPGNDVVSTTALVGSGSNLVLFTTGLGTPTGNPITPVIKISSNTPLYNKMQKIIDFNAGVLLEGEKSLVAIAKELLQLIIAIASGRTESKSMHNGQDDFITWQRRVSL